MYSEEERRWQIAVRICFYIPNAYPLLSNNEDGGFGGAEVKLVLLARSLSNIGYEIYFITKEFVGFYNLEDIYWYKKNLIKYYRRKRFNYFIESYKALRAFNFVNADIYFQRAPGAITGILSLFCRLRRKIFCYIVASSQDVDLSYVKGTNSRNKILYEFGLKNAEIVIVQTKEFKNLLFRNYGIRSYFVRDGITFPTNIQLQTQKKYITFIGGMRPVKNPETFIELAKHFPEKSFLMIGGSLTDENYYQSVKQLAKRERNITFKGHLNRNSIGHYLSQSLILVNTSDREGLPNTITEAWSYGVPVIGFKINPDNLLMGDLGFYCEGDFNLMVEYVNKVINNTAIYKMMSAKCVKYATTYHDIEKISLEIDVVLKTQLTKYYG